MTAIGILGVGYVGETLARRLAALGHSTTIANSRDPQTLRRLATIDGIEPVWAPHVFDRVDIAVLALPQKAIAWVKDELKATLSKVPIVIDAGNYASQRDGDIAELLAGKPTSQWVSEQLERPIFKVLNNIQAHWIAAGGREAGDPTRIALPISGPTGSSLARVETFIDQLGFDTVYNGPLTESWRQQAGTKTYCTNLTKSQLRDELAAATREQTVGPNLTFYFTSNPVDGAAVMRHQLTELKQYFGDEFGDTAVVD